MKQTTEKLTRLGLNIKHRDRIDEIQVNNQRDDNKGRNKKTKVTYASHNGKRLTKPTQKGFMIYRETKELSVEEYLVKSQ